MEVKLVLCVVEDRVLINDVDGQRPQSCPARVWHVLDFFLFFSLP